MPDHRSTTPRALLACMLTISVALGVGLIGCARDTTKSLVPDSDYQFGDVVQGTDVVHEFQVRNNSDSALVIRRVGTSNGASVLHVDSVIAPGAQGLIRVSVPTQNRRGAVRELANIYTTNASKPVASLHLTGNVVFPIEITPRSQAYFLQVLKGESPSTILSIVNYTTQPIQVKSVTSDNPRFAARTEAVKAGREYKLTVTLDSATPVGKQSGRVTVTTDHTQIPVLIIPTFAQIKDSLSTSVDTVQFGQIAFARLDNAVIGRKSVLIEKHGAKDFQVVSAATDIPFLTVSVTPQKPGASAIVNVQIIPKRAKRGRMSGTLSIKTTDPSRPELRLPIRANIV